MLSIIDRETNGEFKELRLRKAVLTESTGVVCFTFSYPRQLNEEETRLLGKIIAAQAFGKYKFKFEIVSDISNTDAIRAEFVRYVRESHITLIGLLDTDGYCISKNQNGGYSLTIEAKDTDYELYEQIGLSRDLQRHFAEYTSTPVTVIINRREEDFRFEEEVVKANKNRDIKDMEIIGRPIRQIPISDVKAIVGKKILGSPMYIMDVTQDYGQCTVCGKISKLSIIEPTKKEKIKYLCKFNLEDFTGTIKIVYFIRDDIPEGIHRLNDGDEIAVYGKASMNSGGRFSELQVIASAISKCRISTDVVIEREPLSEYITVHPQKYEKAVQASLFDVNTAEESPAILTGKDFVVFDLETTGLNAITCEILEIGAVKIRDGVIIETFETLVKPRGSIPDETIKINGIDEETVKDAPALTQVIGDFYKFCYGTVLVGHNVSFDRGFLQYHGKALGYSFNNDCLDTLQIAKNYYSNDKTGRHEPNNYTLSAIAKAFGIEQKDAHRAWDDARVTAEIFIKIAKIDPEAIKKVK